MDMMNIDVSHLSEQEASIGQDVFLINDKIPLTKIAYQANLGYYELLTSITRGRAIKKYL